MGISFRKSKGFGPFRINFTKSGIGLSTGVKGLRVATKPGSKGLYLRGGKGPLRLYKRLDAPAKQQQVHTDVPETALATPIQPKIEPLPIPLQIERAGTIAPKGRVRLDTWLSFDAVTRVTGLEEPDSSTS